MMRNNSSYCLQGRLARFWTLAPIAALAVGGLGCTKESNLRIKVDKHINNAMKPVGGDQSGNPLDVDVVLLTSDDLKRDANRDLKIDSDLIRRDTDRKSGITSDIWFDRHPTEGKGQRFEVPPNQIHRLAQRVGSDDHLHKLDHFDVPGLKDRAGMPSYCVIYVFGRFEDAQEKCLPVEPAVFINPQKDIAVFIGVDANKRGGAPTYGQFIRRD